MATNKKDAAKKLKAIRAYVTFDYDLRKPLHPNSIRKIEKYYNELESIKGLKVKKYKDQNKKRLNMAKSASALELPQFNFAAIPNPEGDIQLGFSKNGLKIKSKNSEKTFYPFNQRKLAADPEEYLDDFGDIIEEEIIMIYAGNSYYRRADDYETIKMILLKLINSYGNHAQWLKGLYGVKNTDQAPLRAELKKSEAFVKAKNANKKKSKYAKAKGR